MGLMEYSVLIAVGFFGIAYCYWLKAIGRETKSSCNCNHRCNCNKQPHSNQPKYTYTITNSERTSSTKP